MKILIQSARIFTALTLLASISQAAHVKCEHFEGAQTEDSLEFDGEVAVLNGSKMACGQIPVSFKTIREFEDLGSQAIAFTCGPQGGGISDSSPTPVRVYTGGWMQERESDVLYALVSKTTFRCER